MNSCIIQYMDIDFHFGKGFWWSWMQQPGSQQLVTKENIKLCIRTSVAACSKFFMFLLPLKCVLALGQTHST